MDKPVNSPVYDDVVAEAKESQDLGKEALRERDPHPGPGWLLASGAAR